MLNNRIQRLLLSPDCPISKAVEILDQDHFFHIAIIIDNNKKVLGVITDGDIRRASLKKICFSDPVSSIMNRKPVTVSKVVSIDFMKQLLGEYDIRQLLITDSHKIIQDVITHEEIFRTKVKNNSVFIMAGGLGSRLRPLTDHIPKPMLHVGGKPILETIVENFVSEGFVNFFFSVNYKSEVIKKHFGDGSDFGCNITYIEENKRLGTAGAMSLIKDLPEDPMIVMNGDLITKIKFQNLIDFHNKNESKATMAIREYNFQVPFGVVALEDSNITDISEKPNHKFFVNAGIYVLSPKAIKEIPEDIFYDMPTLFSDLKEKEFKLSGFPIREFWIDVGRKDELAKANEDYKKVFADAI